MTWNPQPTGNQDDYYNYGSNDAINETLQHKEDRELEQQKREQQLENQSIQNDQESGKDVDPQRVQQAEVNNQELEQTNRDRNPEVGINEQNNPQVEEVKPNTYQLGS